MLRLCWMRGVLTLLEANLARDKCSSSMMMVILQAWRKLSRSRSKKTSWVLSQEVIRTRSLVNYLLKWASRLFQLLRVRLPSLMQIICLRKVKKKAQGLEIWGENQVSRYGTCFLYLAVFSSVCFQELMLCSQWHRFWKTQTFTISIRMTLELSRPIVWLTLKR